jgi:hypothetical protein
MILGLFHDLLEEKPDDLFSNSFTRCLGKEKRKENMG